MRMWIGVVSVLLLLFSACKQDVERQRILKVYGADWSEDGRVMVLGRFTDVRVTYGWLWGASYDTLKNQDVMLWIDPVSRVVDSVWVIHEPGGVLPQSSDMWKDPGGRGWWLDMSRFEGKIYLYSFDFSQKITEIPCGWSPYPKGDSLLFICGPLEYVGVDTVFLMNLRNGEITSLFSRQEVNFVGINNSGSIIISSDHKILRWEGGDSFTVIDSPALYFGFKNDTLVVERDDTAAFVLHIDDQFVDTIPFYGDLSSVGGHCFSVWKWFGNMAVRCREANFTICIPDSQNGRVMVCGQSISPWE